MKAPRARAKAKAGTGRKAKAEPARKTPRPWLIVLGIAVLALLVYLFMWLDRLPQAARVAADAGLKAAPGEQIRLHGVKPGKLLDLTLDAPGSAALSFGKGTRLLANPAEGRPERAGPSGFELDLFNAEHENGSIGIRIGQSSRPAPRIVLESAMPHPDSLALTIRSTDAEMIVDLAVELSDAGGEGAQHGTILLGDERLEEASFSVPAGTPFTIALPVKLLARAEGRSGVTLDLGDYDSAGVRRLDLAAIEAGSGAGNVFDRRAMACGAAAGRILWTRPAPRIHLSDCRPGHVAATDMKLGVGVEIVAQGDGYAVKDGAPHTWPGFREFRQNDVVKAMLTPLLASLAGGILFLLRRTRFVMFLRGLLKRAA